MHQNSSKKSILEYIHPLWLVLLVQFSALLLVKFSATVWVDWLMGMSYVQGFLLLQVGLAVLLSWLMGLPRWWCPA
jgi:hypothetical protein